MPKPARSRLRTKGTDMPTPKQIEEDNTPLTPNEQAHARFIGAVHQLNEACACTDTARIERLLDTTNDAMQDWLVAL
jgi:hypothetical protein